jgi:uncharacterized membrane protein YedE/YeeE
MQTEFTPWLSLGGGVLIGLSAIVLMWLNGRIAGMTGILFGIIPPVAPDWTWRAAFIAGAVLAPALWIGAGNSIEFAVPVSNLALIAGGLIVGIGVNFGGGCTSGHGVCGIARLSPRSIAATAIFMAVTFMTVFVVRHLG